MKKILGCPACGTQMDKVKVSGVVVDVCQKACGGIWFDKSELENFDESHECDKLLIMQTGDYKVDDSKGRFCPVCKTTVLTKVDFASLNKFKTDFCPTCHGTFLDKNELDKLRANTGFLSSNFVMNDFKEEEQKFAFGFSNNNIVFNLLKDMFG